MEKIVERLFRSLELGKELFGAWHGTCCDLSGVDCIDFTLLRRDDKFFYKCDKGLYLT
jgi:hypothetical protein